MMPRTEFVAGRNGKPPCRAKVQDARAFRVIVAAFTALVACLEAQNSGRGYVGALTIVHSVVGAAQRDEWDLLSTTGEPLAAEVLEQLRTAWKTAALQAYPETDFDSSLKRIRAVIEYHLGRAPYLDLAERAFCRRFAITFLGLLAAS